MNNYHVIIKELFTYAHSYLDMCRHEYGDGTFYTAEEVLNTVLSDTTLNDQQKELLKDIINA